MTRCLDTSGQRHAASIDVSVCQHVQGFPLALVCINVTSWAISLLAAGKLNAAARQLNNAVRACDLFVIGAVYKFYKAWVKRGGGTILDVGVQMSIIEKDAKSSPGRAVAAANQVLSTAAFHL